jgi:hypothetical protein
VKVKVITPFSKDAEVMVLLFRLMVSIMSSSFVVDPYNVTDYHHRRNPYSTDNQKKSELMIVQVQAGLSLGARVDPAARR